MVGGEGVALPFSALLAILEMMVERVGKPAKIAMVLTASLALLIVPLGCQMQTYQAQSYPVQQYPPPYRGPQAMAPAPPGLPGTVHLQEVSELIWRFTNEIRRRYGLAALGQEATLSTVAQAYSDDMLRRRFFSHINPEGLTAGDRLRPFFSGPIRGLGENIWEGSNMSSANREALARLIMDSWMSSSGHRQNILSPDFTHLGVGLAASGREIRATQLFANLQRH